jgi:hypothetical protein
MEKIDRRKHYIVVLDTETCPLDKDFNGVSPFNMFVYDIGWAVVDKHGNVYETKSYINRDIFMEEKDLMNSAYYSDKIPKYWEDIKSGKRKVATWYTIRKDLADTMKRYNTKTVCAHNARFDDGATKNTQRWLTKSKYRNFLPYGTIVWDTMKMALDVVAKTPTYKAFCEENGYNVPDHIANDIMYRRVSHVCLRPDAREYGLYEIMAEESYGTLFYEVCEASELD